MFRQGGRFSICSAPRALMRVVGLAAALMLSLLVCGDSTASGQENPLRLRLAWGGGDARSWRGTFRLSEGEILSATPLGLEADAPGSLTRPAVQEVALLPRSPRTYDGCDLQISAPASAVLKVQLTSGDALGETIELPLARVAKGFHSVNLDDRRNRLLVQRAPGDLLRVKIDRSSLVFSPGESFEFTLEAAAGELPPNGSLLLTVATLGARGGLEISKSDREIRTGARGELAEPLPITVAIPPAEGVYDITLSIYPKRLSTPLLRGKPLLERKIQVVAVESVQAPPPVSAEWRTELEIDPQNPNWWERMTRLPTLRIVPGLGAQPLTNGQAGARTLAGRSWVELPPEVWQAYPLSVTEIGKPCILQVEYPTELDHALSISVIEPNAAGQIVPIGLDSGVDVQAGSALAAAKTSRQRLIFWPQTRSPLVLIANRSSERPAFFGKITLLSGPARLPAMRLPKSGVRTRTLAALWDKPLVPENFSAGEALDPATNRTLDDWVTFYDAGERMVQYLQHAGYNAAVITVACEGSAIYPSELLQPTPKYDTGVFFESGQDPLRKDVLELWLRLCDRAGIQLIPAVQFAAPLPELERLKQAEASQVVGLEPLAADGRTWIEQNGARRGLGAYYNPLDERVRGEMSRVIEELTARYSDHPALGGVALQLGPECYSQLCDGPLGLDDRTLQRFAAANSLPPAAVAVGSFDPARFAQRGAALAAEPLASAWRTWRTAQLMQWYAELQRALAERKEGARLVLLSDGWSRCRSTEEAFRRTLSPGDEFRAGFAQMGLSPAACAQAGVLLPRPYWVTPSYLPQHRPLTHASHSSELDLALASALDGAFLFHHEPAPMALPSFDAVSPFGPDKTRTFLVTQSAPAAERNRQRFVHALAVSDSRMLIDGGWLLPLGQEEALANLVRTYRRLPREPFQPAPSRSETGMSPVLVRTLNLGGKTYFYALNDSPWPASLEIELELPTGARVETFAPVRGVRAESRGELTAWLGELEPFDLVGGEIAAPGAKIITWRANFSKAAEDELRRQLAGVRLRINSLRTPRKREVLENPSFESPLGTNGVPGWIFARGDGVTVTLDAQTGHRSRQSLLLRSQPPAGGAAPPVWVRSEPFAPPLSGRAAVVAAVRVADPSQQPKLRLALEGRLDGQSYYRWSNIGLGEDGRPLKSPLQREWTLYRFPLTDLPLSGLSELRVGFDLMSEGEVWIDDVQVHDFWFEDAEREQLLKGVAGADFQLSSGQLTPALRLYESYWPQLLRDQIALPPGAEGRDFVGPIPVGVSPPAASGTPSPNGPATGTVDDANAPSATAPQRSIFDRFRTWLPGGGSVRR